MLRRHSRIDKRSAFTLIELMIVILIIAVLVSLLASGIAKIMDKIPEVRTRTEITALAEGLQGFMNDYQLDQPPPSVLYLNEAAPLSTASGPFLQKVFGKNLGSTDWNGDGAIAPANITWTLEGEQCLVFYLGGIPNTAVVNAALASGNPAITQCMGFSSNNMKPSYGSMVGETMGRRKGPYYQFVSGTIMPPAATPVIQAGRLFPGVLWNKNLSGFYIYMDPWQVKNPPAGGVSHPLGTPYAFFSTMGINNGYTLTCPNLAPLGPYAITAGYTYSNTFQILSAGKDGVFGGGVWIPSNGATGNGADDQANFSSTILGKGQN